MTTGRGRPGLPWATFVLALAMLALQAWSMSRVDALLVDRLGLWPAGMRPWQLGTYAILHATWLHLGINLALFGLFAPGTERRLKAWGLLLVFAGAAVAGGLAHVVFGRPEMVLVGASGAVSGVIAARAVAVPGDRIHLIVAILWVVANVAGWLSDPEAARRLSYPSHLGGAAAGAVLGLVLRGAVPARKPGKPF